LGRHLLSVILSVTIDEEESMVFSLQKEGDKKPLMQWFSTFL